MISRPLRLSAVFVVATVVAFVLMGSGLSFAAPE
jgi:hypothetical protein